MTFLFAHISWMPEYSGKSSEPISSTHGWVVQNNEAGERSNFKAVKGELRGYVPVAEKPLESQSGKITIEKLGAQKGAKYVDGITVIWFANDPLRNLKTFVVGWYRNARVFRYKQAGGIGGYRASCAESDATLLDMSVRNFQIPRKQSKEGRELGFGYGQSSIWYADDASEDFLRTIQSYIDSIDQNVAKVEKIRVADVFDALHDLDGDIGNESPDRKKFSGTYIVRDEKVRAAVKRRSNGFCEYCGEPGFERPDGSRFVEAHHIISLAEQGPDTLDNVIAVCPNHHRQAHFGANWEALEAEFKIILAKIKGK